MNRFVYSNDTVTLSVSNAFYAQGGTNSNATVDLAVTNNSTAGYPKVIGNWTMPAWNRLTNTTLVLSAVGFHQSGRNRRPIRCIKFIISDESANIITNTVTTESVRLRDVPVVRGH
jgi:hypothetical protein